MDLNASPLPEEDEEEQSVVEHAEEEETSEHIETAVETWRREREERRMRLKREYPEEGPKRAVQPPRSDLVFQTRNQRFNDRIKLLPNGWLECPPVGQPIGFIIPSKVPLGESFNDSVVPGKRYSLKQVLHQQKVLGREISLVIDLTNTTRYYSPADWKKQAIKHIKIPCKGRDAVPDNKSVNIFVYEVAQFLSRQKPGSKKHILVHCTHGHNRTGFMIIHFLLRTNCTSVSEALQLFANARPPGIYKQDYIDALYTFYHERRPESVTCPLTPEWKKSSELDLNGDAVQDEDDDGAVTADLQEMVTENVIMTNDDVLGDEISFDHQVDMQRNCCMALGVVARGNFYFPGSQPVSLDRANLQLLRQRYYYATWKADGTRYMMLITRDGCYLIDRNFCFRRVQMRFPMKHTGPGPNEKTHHYTLLDGEMIIDTLPGTHQLERRYLVYDLMMLNLQSVIERPFYERWKLLEKEVIEPRNSERGNPNHSNPHYRYDMEPFRVRRKEFWLLSTVTKLLQGFIPSLSHAADGLIFQGWDDPYIPRTHEGLLKWKYPHLNSVDFQFEVGDENRQILYLLDKGKLRQLEGARVMFEGEVDGNTLSGKIIECSYNKEERCWHYLRTRVDKTTPNGWKTYTKVMMSINDDIKEEDLLHEIAEIIRLPMYADRIAKESQPPSGRRKQ